MQYYKTKHGSSNSTPLARWRAELDTTYASVEVFNEQIKSAAAGGEATAE